MGLDVHEDFPVAKFNHQSDSDSNTSLQKPVALGCPVGGGGQAFRAEEAGVKVSQSAPTSGPVRNTSVRFPCGAQSARI